ncbi:unnamed protein product [Leptidea sinapis]|uniref:Uncharacterized protein n=1 Tax=Leptidea sinapis TaxID=189913 RepID=A0A5E4Q9N5_9NEOP|nr:unnamed protein product [Leptidea sinapis]
MLYRSLFVVVLIVLASAGKEQSRWSRQLSSYTTDISDWVPLPGPLDREPLQPQIRRQAIAEPRILTEPFPGFTRPTGFSQEGFPPRPVFNSHPNRQLYLQAVPSAPQNYLSDQGFGQAIKFGLNQPNFPLNQGFLSPQFNFDNVPQINARPPGIKSGQLPPQSNKPIIPPAPRLKPDIPQFVDGYRLENYTDIYSSKKKAPSMQNIKFQSFDKPRDIIPQGKPKVEREEVQLLYVPLESLNKGQYNFRNPLTSSQTLSSDLYQNQRLNPLKQNLIHDTFNSHEALQNFNSQLVGLEQGSRFVTSPPTFPTPQSTTLKPKKLKPHQPPLAIFLTQDTKKENEINVGDVLHSLKTAGSVAVLDSVNPANAPQVFIGPSTLVPPERYVKFELPYLSNIENIDKKLRQLPFFVAPLSYNTPQGFAKIPFPSPHVGSVVINSQIKDATDAPPQHKITEPYPSPYLRPSAYNVQSNQQQNIVTQKPRITFYSTASPNTNTPLNYQQNYYSLEQQTVNTVRPSQENQDSVTIAPRPGSYFLSNTRNQHKPSQYVNFPNENTGTEQIKYNFVQQTETTTTPRTTITTTSRPTSTHPSQLLETHNPYSINHAFAFNAPIEYHNFFEDQKQTYAPPSSTFPATTPLSVSQPSNPALNTNAVETHTKQRYPSNYLQNYSPEIHYETETQSSGRPSYNSNDLSNTKNEQLPTIEHKEPETKNEPSLAHRKPDTYRQPNTSNRQAQTSYRKPEPSHRQPETLYKQPEISYQQHDTPNTQHETSYRQPESPNRQIETSNRQPQTIYKMVQQIENVQPETNNQNEFQQSHAPNSYYKNEDLNNPSSMYQSEPTPSTNVKTDEMEAYVKEDTPVDYELTKTSHRYGINKYSNEDTRSSETSSSTTTTTHTPTTRRTLRTRGRPRYTSTTVRTDASDYTTRTAITRRPFRERRPITSRPRYDANKITSDKVTKDSSENLETTSKSPITRTRGRIQFKPSVGDDNIYDKRSKKKENEKDLAYQRDVLHQNYPVTLMERTSTVDIEAITEPTGKLVGPTSIDESSAYDTDNAYSNDKLSITEHSIAELTGDNYSSKEVLGIDNRYIPQENSEQNEENIHLTKTSVSPHESTIYEQSDNTQSLTQEKPDSENFAVTESNSPSETQKDDYISDSHETTTAQEILVEKSFNQDGSDEKHQGENVVETTPSYNRVRIRPGLIRQYHQSAPPEASKQSRKKLSQPITYRPAFDRRRTTMRIEEIEADLKTKQVHSRPEIDEHRHPVYKPDFSTELPATSTSDIGKRGQLRRRKPVYTTTITEGAARRPYDVKNRFRGRRPTEKPTETSELVTEGSTSTTLRSTLYNRHSQRTKLSDRYNKQPAQEDTNSEDQELNYSIHRPKYATPDSERWSPKISKDTFMPFNPNDIAEEEKIDSTSNAHEEETDIITARNELNEDILVSVTPASNNEKNKKVPDIPPTLEAYVEQSKVTKSDTSESVSTFESMLEEVMKSLEEQDEDEYTNKVMKHKGGEIGEIPPEKVISSGENYSLKSTTPVQEETTRINDDSMDRTSQEEPDRKSRRRGYWKKVKVRPATESIEVAESQYYTNTVNQLGESVAKISNDKSNPNTKNKITVTTYKPSYQFIKDFFENGDDAFDITADLDIPKINATQTYNVGIEDEKVGTTEGFTKETSIINDLNPGDMDLGTGTPDPTLEDAALYIEPTEQQAQIDRSDGFSFMEYLFGVNSHEEATLNKNDTINKSILRENEPETTKATTEGSFIPEEITAESATDSKTIDDQTELVDKVESSSMSSFMDPTNVISTSMSTEVSHETEICFRGKCIKTKKDLL